MGWIAFILISAAFIWLYIHDRKLDTLEKQDFKFDIHVHLDGQNSTKVGSVSESPEVNIKTPPKKSRRAEIPMESLGKKKTDNWLEKEPKDSNF